VKLAMFTHNYSYIDTNLEKPGSGNVHLIRSRVRWWYLVNTNIFSSFLEGFKFLDLPRPFKFALRGTYLGYIHP
jgi:hypothetical protein